MKWLGRPKLCTKSCRALLRRRSCRTQRTGLPNYIRTQDRWHWTWRYSAVVSHESKKWNSGQLNRIWKNEADLTAKTAFSTEIFCHSMTWTAEWNQLDHNTVMCMLHNYYYLEANVEGMTCMFRPHEQIHDQVPSIHILYHSKMWQHWNTFKQHLTYQNCINGKKKKIYNRFNSGNASYHSYSHSIILESLPSNLLFKNYEQLLRENIVFPFF